MFDNTKYSIFVLSIRRNNNNTIKMKRETIHIRVSPALKLALTEYAAEKKTTITQIVRNYLETITNYSH